MSFGAIAGIAVGVIAGFRCRLPAQVVWRNKRKGTELQSRGSDENAEYYSKPQGIEVAQPYQDDFAHSGCDQVRDGGGHGQPVFRAPDAAPVELDPMHRKHELHGNGHRSEQSMKNWRGFCVVTFSKHGVKPYHISRSRFQLSALFTCPTCRLSTLSFVSEVVSIRRWRQAIWH